MSEKVTALDAVKIQARVVIPIVRALEQELGIERARSIVDRAIAQSFSAWQAKAVATLNVHPRETDIGQLYPVETEVVEDTESSFAVNMTRCRFAEYFRSIGAADVGTMLTCNFDSAAEPVLRPDWEFHRTQTIMAGASHCDFRWRLREPTEGTYEAQAETVREAENT